jgi:hypothetical protein
MKYFVIILLLIGIKLNAQFNPDAGLIVPFTENAIITTSSGNNTKYITDRNPNSYWESTNPLPDNYVKRKDLNIFLNKNLYHTSQIIDAATDKKMNTKTTVKPGILTISFIKPEYLYLASVKYQLDEPVSMTFFSEDSTVLKTISLTPQNNFTFNKNLIDFAVSKIEINSKNAFNIFEIAAMFSPPTEYVNIDLRKSKPVGQILARCLNETDVKKIEVFAGNHPDTLSPILIITPSAIPLIPYLIDPEINVRFLKIVFHLPFKDYFKVKLWEFDVYNKYGPYGKPIKAKKSENKYGNFLGVNTVWGWGYDVYSDLIPKNKGPWVFNEMTSLARIYHRLDWDIKTPQQNPDYANMKKGNGTTANNWLNWDREYDLWNSAGFNIDACIMFNNSFFADTLWKSPYKEAFNLGKNYADHFLKSKIVNMVEVGNEPWSYNSKTYNEILSGFTDGAKSRSNNIILPCATQAYAPYAEINNYIKRYLNSKNISKIDGLNTHIYNYIFDSTGKRKAVNPEDPRAETWSVCNLKRYIDVNIPGKYIYVTEFGYDSDGGKENCTHPVCVSEHTQAVYGIRTTLIFQRLGVKQAYWYFFANVAYSSFLHNRAGLTTSSNTGFVKKESFYAFKTLYSKLKDFYFEKIILENDECYAYRYTDNSNNKIIVAWRPTSKNHNRHKWITLPPEIKISEIIPVIEDKEIKFDTNTIFLSGTPVIIKLMQ